MGAGGLVEDSTEMIDMDQESPSWTEGPKLPRKLRFLTLVETSQGTYAMGGWNGRNSRTEVLQLDCPGDQISSCQWKEVGNLQFARFNHVSFALPESFDVCSGTNKIHYDFVTTSILFSIVALFSMST